MPRPWTEDFDQDEDEMNRDRICASYADNADRVVELEKLGYLRREEVSGPEA